MPDYVLSLTDKQRDELRAAAEQSGMSAEEFAASAVSHAIASRYVLAKSPASVMPFQGLKSSGGKP